MFQKLTSTWLQWTIFCTDVPAGVCAIYTLIRFWKKIISECYFPPFYPCVHQKKPQQCHGSIKLREIKVVWSETPLRAPPGVSGLEQQWKNRPHPDCFPGQVSIWKNLTDREGRMETQQPRSQTYDLFRSLQQVLCEAAPLSDRRTKGTATVWGMCVCFWNKPTLVLQGFLNKSLCGPSTEITLRHIFENTEAKLWSPGGLVSSWT